MNDSQSAITQSQATPTRRRYRDLRRQRVKQLEQMRMTSIAPECKTAKSPPQSDRMKELQVDPSNQGSTEHFSAPMPADSAAAYNGREVSNKGSTNIVDLWEYGQKQIGFVVKAPPPEPHCKLQYTGSFGVGYTCLVCGLHREWKKATHCSGRNTNTGKEDNQSLPLNNVFPYNAYEMIQSTTITHHQCSQKAHLLRLATELQQEILQFLDFRTVCHIDLTCTGFYAATHCPGFAEIILARDLRLHKRLGFDLRILSVSWKAWGVDHKNKSLGAMMKKDRNTAAAARIAQARFKCFTMMLQREQSTRISRYSSDDVRINQIFRNRLHVCSMAWVEFMISELTELCHINAHRSSHNAFITKLRFIDKELLRRRHGRKAKAEQALISRLGDLRRRVDVAVRIGKKPRRGEARIRDLKCNWRK